MEASIDSEYRVAKSAFVDTVMFNNMKVGEGCKYSIKLLYSQNPVNTMPVVWNDEHATPALKSQLLWEIRRRQSPGIVRLFDAFRSPEGGLPVCLSYHSLHYHGIVQVVGLCEDTFYIKSPSSNDPDIQVPENTLNFESNCYHYAFRVQHGAETRTICTASKLVTLLTAEDTPGV